MAIFLGTNAVVVTRVHCNVKLNNLNTDGPFTMHYENTPIQIY